MEAGLRLRAALGHSYYSSGFRRVAASGNGNGVAVGPVGSGVEVARAKRMLHVVLVSPLIPGNTGSIARTCAASAVGLHLVGDFSYKPGDWLVFGSETKGLPQRALEDCCREGLGGGAIRIPMVETYVRCLNLSVSVGIALYEAARQLNYEQLQYQPELPEEAQGLFPAEDIYA
ncbi:hypothetical protein BAE44_0018390 [Dichanthelium oligosanthes]|uniref:tRNA/rRNA methyltransferase SpoU type domain-containing protein n=1 Tax=Dichanthelium oligosanthes TaxID=888268 RepID=A0A1E5V600_9POAL|nr:hypothetical protein BAE44_0018390 [Dichanthelium oligosanthes]